LLFVKKSYLFSYLFSLIFYLETTVSLYSDYCLASSKATVSLISSLLSFLWKRQFLYILIIALRQARLPILLSLLSYLLSGNDNFFSVKREKRKVKREEHRGDLPYAHLLFA